MDETLRLNLKIFYGPLEETKLRSCHVRQYIRVFSVFGGVSLSKFKKHFLETKCFTCYVRVFFRVFSVGIWPVAIAMLGCYLGCSSLYILCIWLSGFLIAWCIFWISGRGQSTVSMLVRCPRGSVGMAALLCR